MGIEPNPLHLLPNAPMDLTVHELELLVDAIDWELFFLEKKGWHDSKRADLLRDLQSRIQQFALAEA